VIAFVSKQSYSQTTIIMENEGGVYTIPCNINGMHLNFIFDTGASDVCLSEDIALKMFEEGYLGPNDIIGASQSIVADGRIVDNTRLNLKRVVIGDRILTNIGAVVLHNQATPLLLGQTAIQRLGRFTIAGNKLMLGVTNKRKLNKEELSFEEAMTALSEAREAYENDSYEIAIEKYELAISNADLDSFFVMRLAECYYYLGDITTALDIFLDIKDELFNEHPQFRPAVLYEIGRCYASINDFDTAISYLNRAKTYVTKWTDFHLQICTFISMIYKDQGLNFKASNNIDNLISRYLDFLEIKITDCWTKGYKDEYLGKMLYYRYLFSKMEDKYAIIAAAWGDKDGIETCDRLSIDYTKKPYKYEY
jgi:clan AA aspartic protease (TIGR02281 family)